MKFSLKFPRRASSEGSSEKAASAQHDARPPWISLERAWLTAFVGIALVLAGLAWFLFDRLTGQQASTEDSQIERMVDSYGLQLGELMRRYVTSLEYAAKDPDLAQILRDSNAERMRAKETELSFLFPEAVRVRVLAAGIREPDQSTIPPLDYACVNLLYQAESGDEPPPAEVHLYGSPQQHIAMVRPVKDADGRVVGNLLVDLSVSMLGEVLGRLNIDSRAYLELRQVTSKGAVLRLSAQGTRPQGEGASYSAGIPGTRWSLAYWPAPPAQAFGEGGQLWYWGAFGGGLLLLGLLLYVLYRLLGDRLRADQKTVLRLFKDASEGDVAPHYTVRMRNFLGTVEQLRHSALSVADAANRPSATAHLAGLNDLKIDSDALSEQRKQGEMALPSNIFRAYDIRGLVGQTLTPEVVYQLGGAIGSEAHARGQQKIVVARDGRLSSPDLSSALVQGLMAAGREVFDIGRVPTPVLYFAAQYIGTGSGVMITGSHNPPDYNGLKITLRGESLRGEEIQALRTRIEHNDLFEGHGSVQSVDVAPSYIERITSDVRVARNLKVVVDAGNGVAGEIAPRLLRALGCEVIELYCEIDGHFPNHHPDPGKPENLITLARAVPQHGADLGVAFDGDGDRLGVVDSAGKIIWPDRLLMLLASDVLLRHPGAQIIYDVKCSRHLEQVVKSHGGQPLMAKTGHSYIKAKLQETGALLAGEMSGHIFYRERWFGFDDALYACARLLEILSLEQQSSSKVFGELPESVSTPELNVKTREGEHFELMQRLVANARFGGARLITIDGLRAEFDNGWGLVRASNTTPSLVLRFEADDAEALRRIQDEFRHQLLALDPDLELPF